MKSTVINFMSEKNMTYKTFDLRMVKEPMLAYYLKKYHESNELYKHKDVKAIRKSRHYNEFKKDKSIFDLDDVMVLDDSFKILKPSYVDSKKVVTFIQRKDSQDKYRILLEKIRNEDYHTKFANYVNLKDPTVIMLSGYPGSGKSTLSSYFKSIQFKIVDGDKLSPQKMKEEVKKLMLKKKNMLIDGTFMTEKSRKAYIDIVKDTYNVHLIEVTTDVIESYVRNVKRSLDKTSKRTLVPIKVYRNFLKSYESPSYEEGFTKIEHYPSKTIKGGTIRKLKDIDFELFNLLISKEKRRE